MIDDDKPLMIAVPLEEVLRLKRIASRPSPTIEQIVEVMRRRELEFDFRMCVWEGDYEDVAKDIKKLFEGER